MTFRLFAIVAALACINVVAGHHLKAPIIDECPAPIVEACPVPVIEACPEPIVPPCPKPTLPSIEPIVLQSVIPAPFTFGPLAPGVLSIEHVAAPVVEACPTPVVEACPEPIVEACPEPIVEACPEPIAPVCPVHALPVIEPIVIKSVIPGPFTIGPQAPGVIEHKAAPYEINYFEKPWILKHAKSAALNIFAHHPVVVDEYAAPTVSELEAPAAVIVEEVCGEAPALCPAPAPCC